MARRKPAARRPQYDVGHRWCCHVCQEVHQLRCAAVTAPLLEDRMLAVSFVQEIAEIANGRYLGVDLSNLFD